MAQKPKQKHQPTRAAMYGEHAMNAHATKSGPGRYHKGGMPGTRIGKPRAMRAYLALMAAWAAKRVTKWQGPRDEHGAITLVGRRKPAGAFGKYMVVRRPWLAGISAQRGY